MIFTPTGLDGAFLVDLDRHEDERGFFARISDEEELAGRGLDGRFAQWSVSYNHVAGTLRGMHWQAAPYAETKLVRCIRGAIFDVIVDLRPSSATHGHWLGAVLDDDERRALLVPPHFAHGFQTLADSTEVLYGITPAYRADASRGFRWDDPAVGIDWPDHGNRVISDRDRALPLLSDAT